MTPSNQQGECDTCRAENCFDRRSKCPCPCHAPQQEKKTAQEVFLEGREEEARIKAKYTPQRPWVDREQKIQKILKEAYSREDLDREWAAAELASMVSLVEQEAVERVRERLAEELDRLRVQLAGCSVAALGWSKGEQKAKRGDYGWSPSYQDVLDLREKYEALLPSHPHTQE